LNSALLRGWQSTAQKEWLKSRTVVEVHGTGANTATTAAVVLSSSGASVGQKRSASATVVASAGDTADSAVVATKVARAEAPASLGHHVVSTASLADIAGSELTKQTPQPHSYEEGHVGLPSSTGVHTVFVHKVATAE
jgi:hypothetical protein